MACEIISSITTISDLLVWPTGCDYYFWLKILGGLLILLAFILFKAEESRTGRGEMIGSLAVSSIAITVIASIGTLVSNTDGIPMIQSDILLYLIAICVPIVLVWIFKD